MMILLTFITLLSSAAAAASAQQDSAKIVAPSVIHAAVNSVDGKSRANPQEPQASESLNARPLKNYDTEYESEEVIDASGAPKVNAKKDNQFLRDIEKLYARGFRHSHALRTGRDHNANPVFQYRSDESLAHENSVDGQRGRPVMRNVVLAGRKAVNLSTLPFIPMKPHLTVQSWDLGKDDKVTLYVSVAFENRASFSWLLNDQHFDEYDALQTVDMHNLVFENKTFHTRVCILEVEHLLKLPTRTGKYEINCTVSVDYNEASVGHILEPQLTDDCPPANCYDRHAVCKEGKCFCDTPYSVRLNSVHTTCRTESFLETPCHHTDQCLKTTNNSECLEQGWCACKKGYGRTPQQRCVEKSGIDARCDSDSECSAVNASCIVSHCTCTGGSIEDNGHCTPQLQGSRSFHGAAQQSGAYSVARGQMPILLSAAFAFVVHRRGKTFG